MNKEQIKNQLDNMRNMLEAMKEDKVEASAFYEEDSEFMTDLDLDILLCSATIKELTRQIIERQETKNG
jgi:predicted  nucleic acid-binding Zn-ribbon protein